MTLCVSTGTTGAAKARQLLDVYSPQYGSEPLEPGLLFLNQTHVHI